MKTKINRSWKRPAAALKPALLTLRKLAATAFLALLALAGFTQPAQAANRNWLSGTSNWDVSANWSGNVLPTFNDTAYVDNGGTALVPLGVTGTPSFLNIGYSGIGNLSLTGGLIFANTCYLGYNQGSNGTATVTSGTLLTSDLHVGLGGTGTLNLNGGTVTSAFGYIGEFFGSNGTATVTSGTWNSSFLDVGSTGTGVLNLDGSGMVIVNNGLGTLNLCQFGSRARGTLNIGLSGTAGTLNALALNGGIGTAMVNFYQGNTTTFAPNLTGTLSLKQLGAGTTLLTGSSSFSGTTTIASGALQLGNGGSTGSLGSTAIVNNSLLIFNRSDSLTFDNLISGSGSLLQSGSGTTILTGSKSYSGGTKISLGTLQFAELNAMSASGTVSAGSGGTLRVNAGGAGEFTNGTSGNGTLGGLFSGLGAQSGATVVLSPGAFVGIDTTNAGGALTYSGTIANPGVGLAKYGTGVLVLTGSNSYSGGTTIASGTLQIGNGGFTGSLGSGSVVNNTLLIFNRSNLLTAANLISGSGSLFQSGSGTTILTGSNSYLGGTTIGAGMLQLGNALALGGTIAGLAVNAGTLDLAGYSPTIGILSGSNGAVITNRVAGAVTLTVNQTANGAYSGAIQNGSGTIALTKTGTGTLTLSGSNSYTGATMVTGGSLQLNAGGSINHSGNDLIIGNVSGDNGALILSGGSVTNRNGYLGNGAGSNGTATVTSGTWRNSNLLYVGNSGTGALNVNGGTVTDSSSFIGFLSNGTATVTSGTWANSSQLYVGWSGTGALNINGGTVTDGSSFIGFLSNGTATVTSGTWANSSQLYVGWSGTGALNINGGTVTDSSSLIGTTAGSNGTATVTSGNWSNSSLFVGSSGTGTVSLSGGMINDLWDYLAYYYGSVGTASLASGTWNTVNDFNVGEFGQGNLNLSGGTLTSSNGRIGHNAGSIGTAMLTGGMWSLGTQLIVGDSGAGTLDLSDTGVVSIANGTGTLVLANNAGSTGTLNLGTGGAAGTLNAAFISGGSGLATVNFNHNSSGYSFSPQLTGTLAVNQNGTGTTILSATNTYTGPTQVNAGTLVVSGALSASATTTVAIGAILASGSNLTSSVGPVTLTSGSTGGGTLSPGGSSVNSFGKLTVNGALTLGNFGTAGTTHLAMKLGNTNAGTGYDQVAVTGTVSLNNVNLDLTLSGYTANSHNGEYDGSGNLVTLGDTFFLVLGNSPISGTFANTQPGQNYSGGYDSITVDGQLFAINYASDGISFNSTGGDAIALMAIPEPAAWQMLVGGFGALLVWRRRR